MSGTLSPIRVPRVIAPILTLLAVAAPEVVNPAVARGAVLSAEAQWNAIAACPLVVIDDQASFGTAVVVGHKDGFAYLLTAAHVIEGTRDREFRFFTRDSYPRPARTVKGGNVLLRSQKPDFALVQVKVGDDRLPELKLAGPGQRPKRFPFEAVSVGCPFGGWPQARAETVSAKLLKRPNDVPEAFFWQTAAPPEKGRSGGPLLDAQGRVIGVCAATQDDRGYFTHLDEILAGLKRAKHEWLWAD